MERWCGKVALVTGASAGMGAAIAEQLVRNGVKVVGFALDAERIDKLKANWGKVKGDIIPWKGDVTNEEDVEKVFKFIKEKFGSIHILVNNAGIVRTGSIRDGNLAHFKDVINVNFVGLVSCTQKALRLMKETGIDDGHIVLLCSITGHYVPKIYDYEMNVYPSTKHAVYAFTEALRQELTSYKSKIRVTSISPGLVATELLKANYEATGCKPTVDAEEERSRPLLNPKDVADAVIYALAAPAHVQIHDIIIRPVGEVF